MIPRIPKKCHFFQKFEKLATLANFRNFPEFWLRRGQFPEMDPPFLAVSRTFSSRLEIRPESPYLRAKFALEMALFGGPPKSAKFDPESGKWNRKGSLNDSRLKCAPRFPVPQTSSWRKKVFANAYLLSYFSRRAFLEGGFLFSLW